jgi:hypothetical protein
MDPLTEKLLPLIATDTISNLLHDTEAKEVVLFFDNGQSVTFWVNESGSLDVAVNGVG